ncbi:hypothetical protein BOX15_Mlig030387g3, partial [Macrostomum lignano]
VMSAFVRFILQAKRLRRQMPYLRRKRGLWRLFACTEAAKEFSDDEDGLAVSTEFSDTNTGRRRKQQRGKTVSHRHHGRLDSRTTHSSHLKRRSSKTKEDDSFESDYATCDEDDADRNKARRQSLRRRPHHHHHHHHRGHRTCRCPSGGDAASQAACTSGACRSRVSKRLMVAMLEDGATGQLSGCGACHRGKMRVRTTRDEVSIRRIFHQLSATMDANYPSESPLEIPRSSALRTAHRGQAGNLASPRTSRTMTLPASPQQQPLARTRQLPASPPEPPPRPSQEPQAVTPPASEPPMPPPRTPVLPAVEPRPQAPQPSEWVRVSVQSSTVQQQEQHLQQKQQQQSDSEQKSQQQSPTPQPIGLANKSQQSQEDKKTAIRGSGRRGYRLFRRVFSASDNYYAAPFPPMETIKLTSDEDQWEDLEILVTGHNGVKAIAPKTADSAKPDNRNQPDAVKSRQVASLIPRPLQPSHAVEGGGGGGGGGGQPSAAGDMEQLPQAIQKQQSLKPMQQQRQQQQQQQINQCNQLQSPTKANYDKFAGQGGASRAQKISQDTSVRQFGFSRQQHQQLLQQQQQQRRANPLMSPNRLLHRLGPPCSDAVCGRQRAILLPPAPPPPPLSPFGASPKPRREQPAAREFGAGARYSSRYGKL